MSDKKELPTVEGGPGGELCRTCYFWVDSSTLTQRSRDQCYSEERIGVCKRMPPVLRTAALGGQLIDDEWYQPWRLESDWCGEWRAKPGAKKGDAKSGDLLTFPPVTIPADNGWDRYDEAKLRDWIDRRIRGMKKAYCGAAGQGSLCNHYRQFLFSWVRFESFGYRQASCPSVEDMRQLMDSAPDDVTIFRHLLADNRLSPPAKEFVRKVLAQS